MERYLDKIHDLEASKQGMATQAKLVEQYKDRAVELEREKFEAVSGQSNTTPLSELSVHVTMPQLSPLLCYYVTALSFLI